MKKIPSLFKRDYEGDRLIYDEVVPGCEWVPKGEGVATVKFDGTACMARDGELYKRYDRKLTRAGQRRFKQGQSLDVDRDFKPAPPDWEPCEPKPNEHTGHWPGWMPVGDGPEDKWHRKALDNFIAEHGDAPADGTWELVGPKVQDNPHQLDSHQLKLHGLTRPRNAPPRDFKGLRAWFVPNEYEGIVWHHPDGRMCKIKRRDFGLAWPPERKEAK